MNCLCVLKYVKIRTQPIRLYSAFSIRPNINDTRFNIDAPNTPKTIINRNFSIQSTIESFIKTQSGIFKSISESTPVAYIQGYILDIHSFTGLPWWASIICTTILLRSCVTVPLAIYQNYILAKLENLKGEMPGIIEDLKRETAIAIRKFNWKEQDARIVYNRSLQKQWNALIIRDNCHPFKASLLLWVQLPMWICLSISLRNLVYMLPKRDIDAAITFTELSIGGIAWIPNLTLADTSLILPVTLGLVNLAIIEIQSMSKVNVPTKFQRYATNFFRGISLIMIPISASVPSCMCVYWVTSSTYGLVQNLVLMSPTVKRLTGIPKTPSEVQQPYSQLLTKFKNRINFRKTIDSG